MSIELLLEIYMMLYCIYIPRFPCFRDRANVYSANIRRRAWQIARPLQAFSLSLSLSLSRSLSVFSFPEIDNPTPSTPSSKPIGRQSRSRQYFGGAACFHERSDRESTASEARRIFRPR